MSRLSDSIEAFGRRVSDGDVEVYNEFSLQHELGIQLRNDLAGFNVQFERNVAFFGFEKREFTKRELDIAVFSEERLHGAIELKYPRNGQYPEQMFSFCKDIAFAEELKRAGFEETFVLIYADDRLFYEGTNKGIYGFFRAGRKLHGLIQKPTGKKNQEIYIRGSYEVTWIPLAGSLKCATIKIEPFE